MRIIVVSDSHGDAFAICSVIERQRSAAMLIHLGDGERDMLEVEGCLGLMRAVRLRGNCDLGSVSPSSCVEFAGGQKIYCTHGYAEAVKFGFSALEQKAREQGAAIALFGHTHEPYYEYRDGLHLFNPGSIRHDDYGVVDIEDRSIVCIHMKIN